MGGTFVKINVAAVSDNKITVYFKYNQFVIEVIKNTVPYQNRSYISENKTWTFGCEYIPTIVNNLMKSNRNGEGVFTEVSALVEAYGRYCNNTGKKNEIEIPQQPERLQQPFLFEDIDSIKASIQPVKNKEIKFEASIKKTSDEFSDFFPSDDFFGSFFTEKKPLTDDLKYPDGTDFKPYEHQVEGAHVLLKGKKYILADTMGLGKTFTSIIAAYNNPGRRLIITPASLKLNWKKEINRFGVPEENIRVVSGKTFKEDIEGKEDWVILNYDLLRKLGGMMSPARWAKQFKTAIFDEAHYCKAVNNRGLPGSQRGTYALEIAKNIPNVYLLSGTPITNKTKDIYMLLKMIGSPIAEKWFVFATRYCDAHRNNFGWECDGASNREELNRRLRSCLLRRRTEDVLTMPQKIRSFIPVEADLREYNSLLNEYLQSKEEDSECALAALGKLKQAVALGKVDNSCALISDLLENGKSVVVYTCYLDVVNKIEERFAGDCVRITGSVSADERQKAVEEFQAGKKRVIVCTIAAGGVGLTLTKSDVVVFNDFDYTAANIRQAEDRIWRIGQKNRCSIFFVYADKCVLDETLCNMLNGKLSNMGVIVDGKEESLITEEDENNQMILLQQLMEMKKKRILKRKRKSKST
ncbi:MAG: DEAD/DEAH box helicase [Anaerolineaceae bacterium]|nr:DEAD/DEAH box helicase [Anaerolineaceae bacterium]